MRQGFAETAAKWENGGPGEIFVRFPDGVPGVCIFAEGVRHRAPRVAVAGRNCVRPAAALRDFFEQGNDLCNGERGSDRNRVTC